MDELKAFITEILPVIRANFPIIVGGSILIVGAIGFSLKNTK